MISHCIFLCKITANFISNFDLVCRNYFSMCLAASIVMLAVLVLRIVLWRLPKKYLCILWYLAIFRLLCPMELLPSGPLPMAVNSSALQPSPSVNNTTDNSLLLPANPVSTPTAGQYHEPAPIPSSDTAKTPAGVSENRTNGTFFLYVILGAGSFIGSSIFLCIFLVRYIRLGNILLTSTLSGLKNPANNASVWVSDAIGTPMVFGIFPPRIYVPSDFANTTEAMEQNLILRHEAAHICRLDYLLRPLSYVALSLHWWNPLAWCSMLCLQRDMEMACDEAVMTAAATDVRKAYAATLLHYSMVNSGLTLPLTFGESNTERRVKNILTYHKRPFWFSLLALALTAAIVVCLGTKPYERQTEEPADFPDYDLTNSLYVGELTYNFEATPVFNFPSFDTLKAQYLLYWKEQIHTDKQIFVLEPEIRMENYTQEGNWNKDFSLCLRYCTFDERFIPTLYVTYITCAVEDMSVYATNSHSDISYEHIKDYATACSFTCLPYEEQQLWPFRITNETMCLSTCLSQHALLSSSHAYDFLRDPLTALPALLHLESGVCARIAENEEGCYVSYTFYNDKEHLLTYFMYEENGFWFPKRLVCDESSNTEQSVYEYITKVTADELKPIHTTPENYNENDLLVLSDNFVLLSQADSVDVALYGLFGGEAMVVRDGNHVYPLYHSWEARLKPQIYKQDFDLDGVEEYGILEYQKDSSFTHTGNVSSVDSFYILEPAANGLQMYFAPLDRRPLSDRLHYTWREATQTISFFLAGDTALDTAPRELENFYWPHHADTIYSTYAVDHYDDYCVFFILNEGRLWRKTTSYATLWNVDIHGEITLMEELIYEGNGRFSYGEASLSLPAQ